MKYAKTSLFLACLMAFSLYATAQNTRTGTNSGSSGKGGKIGTGGSSSSTSTGTSSSSSGSTSGNNNTPTQAAIANGLKEALQLGIKTTVKNLNQKGGYLNDGAIKIPFPQDAQFVATELRKFGAGKLVDDFEVLLNRAAEDAADEALPIFTNAITKLTIADAGNILLSGNQRAATDFFQQTTREQLYNAFSPKVKKSLDVVQATKYWADIVSRYNKIPFVQRKIETDLVRYATNKALDGLFLKVAAEEARIRQDPALRVSSSLQNIFGFMDNILKNK